MKLKSYIFILFLLVSTALQAQTNPNDEVTEIEYTDVETIYVKGTNGYNSDNWTSYFNDEEFVAAGGSIRVFDFAAGGKYTKGFYLSQRDADERGTALSYGEKEDAPFTLPAGDVQINIIASAWQGNTGNFLYELFDEAGSVVASGNGSADVHQIDQATPANAASKISFNVENCKAGNYVLRITTNTGGYGNAIIVWGLNIKAYKGNYTNSITPALIDDNGETHYLYATDETFVPTSKAIKVLFSNANESVGAYYTLSSFDNLSENEGEEKWVQSDILAQGEMNISFDESEGDNGSYIGRVEFDRTFVFREEMKYQLKLKVYDLSGTTLSEEEYNFRGVEQFVELEFLVDGVPYAINTAYWGDKISLADVPHPEKPGYTFVTWEPYYETMPKGGGQCEAVYEKNTYSIVFKIPEANFEERDSLAFGDSISVPTPPELSGLTFGGWDNDVPKTMPDKDLVFIGNYTSNAYDIVYIVDGEEYYKQNLSYGAEVKAPDAPTKTGYTFSGWSEIPATMPAQQVTVVGSFTINKYKVTFANGDELVKTDSLEYGKPITMPEAPAVVGHTFKTWTPSDSVIADHDMVFNAVYEVNTYKVTFKIPETGFEVIDSVQYGGKITVPTVPDAEGKTFGGWDNAVPTAMPDKDLVFIGNYTTNAYEIVYLVDSEEYYKQNLSYGAEVKAPDSPTKTGYTFSGWSEIPATMPAQQVTVVGSFTINKYKVTFANGDELVKTDSVEYGKPITMPEAPAVVGHTFKSWTPSDSIMADHDMVFNAIYEVNTYTVTFKIPETGFEVIDSVQYGGKITVPTVPNEEGKTFGGWDNAVPTAMPDKDLVFIGNYTSNAYDIVYLVDGEEYYKQNLSYGAEVKAPDSPTKTGYTFSGWSEIPLTMPAQQVTVVGSFTINKYKVTFTNGDELVKTDSVEYGKPITMPDAPAVVGHTFKTWTPSDSIMADHDMVFNAVYEVNTYKVTFKIPETGFEVIDSVQYGGKITVPTVPDAEGKTFGGWDNAVPTAMPDKDLVFIGNYTTNAYEIVYLVDGEEYYKQNLSYGAEVKAPDAPTKTGYTFSGWSEIPATMPAQQVTVVGSFTINKYKVTFANGDELVKTDSLEYGKPITMPEAPAVVGHTFKTWTPSDSIMVDHDMVFNAVYEINTYKVTFKIPETGFEVIDSVQYGGKITVPTVPDAEGKTFGGWDNAVPTSMPDKDLVFIGNYTTNAYEIAYLVDGVEYYKQNLSYGAEVKAPDAPTKTGYTFSGWSEIPATMPAQQVTVVGSFTINKYKVTFANGDELVKTDSVEYGKPITMPDAPTVVGHTFKSWTPSDSIMADHDMVFNAIYEVNTYTITFKIPETGFEKTDSVAFGTAIIAPTAPNLDGLTFMGWNEEVPATMPDSSIVFIGSYSANAYQVIYYVGNEVYHVQYLNYGDPVIAIAPPSKQNYTFSGWENVPAIMPATDVKVSGYFTLNVITPDEHSTTSVDNPDGLLADLLHEIENIKILHVSGKMSDDDIDCIKSLPNLLVLYWDSDQDMSEEVTNGKNANLLVYAASNTTIVPDNADLTNIVQNGKAENIELVDGEPLIVTEPFTASTVSYSRTFDKPTVIGKSSGWETLTLPFEATSVTTADGRNLAPFSATYDNAYPFWLGTLSDNGFSTSASIAANVPSILSMPNNDSYTEDYIISGEVQFLGTNATVESTLNLTARQSDSYILVSAYEAVEASDSVYVLNDDYLTDSGVEYVPGSVFVRNLRPVRPFEAYLVPLTPSAAKMRVVPVSGNNQSSDIIAICTDANRTNGKIYTLDGKLVSDTTIDSAASKRLAPGIYIINGHKVVIRQNR